MLQPRKRCRALRPRWPWRPQKRFLLLPHRAGLIVLKALSLGVLALPKKNNEKALAHQVNNDPKLKTKAEKDRRLKEKQAANTKKIIDERKSKGMKENKASWKEE